MPVLLRRERIDLDHLVAAIARGIEAIELRLRDHPGGEAGVRRGPAAPALSETIEVSIVNVDVIVTHKDGSRVRNLSQSDFEIYENGISRALSLDYNDFVVAGKMTALEVRPSKPCN